MLHNDTLPHRALSSSVSDHIIQQEHT